jgi:hypothetical protein
MRILLGGEIMMPQYFFDVRSIAWSYHDPDGITLADDDTAISYAERMIRELKADEGYDAPDLQMLVKNRAQNPIIVIPFNPTNLRVLKKHYSIAPIGIT